MKKRFSSAVRNSALASVAVAALAPVAVYAQEAPDEAAVAKAAKEEIVVTGTSLRGVAPAGAATLAVDSAAIEASGATSAQALLANIPQMNSFGSTPYAGIGGTRLTVNRINLRNLPQGTGGGSPTLTLIDGHRFVGSGIQQAIPDPSIIPPGMVERVEVVLGGGSAVYGADAIGGVLNFITKKEFDGVQISGNHGIGDNYHTNNVDVLAGKKWDTGSVYVGYSYAQNSAINNIDRDYERQGSYASGAFAFSGLQCDAGNVVINAPNAGAGTYAITSPTTLAAGTANLCDVSKYGEQFPKETRHAVMGGITQEMGDSIELTVKGYYATRKNALNSGPLGFTLTKASSNPGYIPASLGNTSTQNISGNVRATTGGYVPTDTKLTSWGITPSIKWQIGGDWVMNAFYNVGESKTTVHQPQINTPSLQAAVNAGTFNAYDPGAASNATALATALNWENYGIGISHMDNAKLVFDGPIFRLPGGDVLVAVGAEYLKETYKGINNVIGTIQSNVNTTTNPLSRYKRNEKSGFGEINIPIVGPDNSMTGIYSFNITGAVRYDDYSDFGENWSPNVGASLKPVEWINLRGNWNKSFQAPSPADLAFAFPQITYRPSFIYGFAPLLVNGTTNLGTLQGGGNAGATTANGFLSITGTKKDLQPQKATNMSFGADISPPFIPGLTLSGGYFNIKYYGTISLPPHGFGGNYYTDYPTLFAMNPTYAQTVAFLASSGASAAAQTTALTNANCTGPGACNLYFISSDLTQNLGNAKVSGLDLGFNYKQDTGFGSLYASFNGTRILKYKVSPSPTGAFSANGAGNQASGSGVSKFNFTGTLGVTVNDGIRAQIKWNHLDGYSLSVPAGLGQTSIGSYNTLDFYSAFDVKQAGLAEPITLSLGVTNLLDKNPPNYNGTLGQSNGYSGSTLGRVVTLGASVKF